MSPKTSTQVRTSRCSRGRCPSRSVRCAPKPIREPIRRLTRSAATNVTVRTFCSRSAAHTPCAPSPRRQPYEAAALSPSSGPPATAPAHAVAELDEGCPAALPAAPVPSAAARSAAPAADPLSSTAAPPASPCVVPLRRSWLREPQPQSSRLHARTCRNRCRCRPRAPHNLARRLVGLRKWVTSRLHPGCNRVACFASSVIP